MRRRELGAILRALRTEAGMTVEQVAESVLCSPSKVSRLETGQRGASARDIRDLSDLYQLDPAQREHLNQLAKEGRSQAWWQPYGLPYETGLTLRGLAWRKAQRSVGDGACVEIAPVDGMIAMRDSKDPDGAVLMCAAAEWGAFLRGAKAGEFDDLC